MLSQHCCSLHWAGQMGFGGLISSFGLGVWGLCYSLLGAGSISGPASLLFCCISVGHSPGPVPGHETLIMLLAKAARDQQR